MKTDQQLPSGLPPLPPAPAAEAENIQLRAIFPKILESLKSGACSPECSVEFLGEIPKEVRLVKEKMKSLERRAIAAEAAFDAQKAGHQLTAKMLSDSQAKLSEAREALESIARRCPIMGSVGQYRHGQLDALHAVAEQARKALTNTQ